jgi:hypothetical protein
MQDQEAVKILFRQFLDCKDNTAVVADRGNKLDKLTPEIIQQVIAEQTHCLTIIKNLQQTDSALVTPYLQGIKATEARILTENKLYNSFETLNAQNALGLKLSLGIVNRNEEMIWKTIKESKDQVVKTSGVHIGFGSFLFMGILGLFTLYVYFGKSYNIRSENVKNYFDKQIPSKNSKKINRDEEKETI